MLCGNAANIYFPGKSSLLSKHASKDEHWSKAVDCWVYYYLQLEDTVKYVLKIISICINKEQCSDQAESE
jgi:hypothetical protein